MTAAVRALIFDMDGTLVDNMPAHTAAWAEWHRRRGMAFDASSFFGRTAGRTDLDIIGEILPGRPKAEFQALVDEKQAIYRELFLPHRRLANGASALFDEADRLGLVMAVATAAPLPNVDFILDGLAIRHRFRAVVSPALGLRAKPHPDMFLAAARAMGVPPTACVVFEDAPLGIEAAARAGMPVIAIGTTLPAAALAAPHVLQVRPDFTGIDLAALTGSAASA